MAMPTFTLHGCLLSGAFHRSIRVNPMATTKKQYLLGWSLYSTQLASWICVLWVPSLGITAQCSRLKHLLPLKYNKINLLNNKQNPKKNLLWLLLLVISHLLIICLYFNLYFQFFSDFIDLYEFYHSSSWRQKSLDLIYDHMCFDNDVTHCISIGPVSKLFHLWGCHVENTVWDVMRTEGCLG